MPRTSRRSTPTFSTRSEVREAMEEMLAEYPDRNFPPEAREQRNQLADVDHEFDVREQFILQQYENPKNRDGESERDSSRRSALPPRTARADDPRSVVREAALRANERAEFLPEECRERIEDALPEDDDEQGRLAHYVAVASDRDYFRAFAKLLNDPQTGAHLWTLEERAAVHRVQSMTRALALGSQGGGFLVPYELDPQILIASAGTINPLRKIARVTTTSQNVKKFVTSLGVTTEWLPESTEAADGSPTALQPSVTCKKGARRGPASPPSRSSCSRTRSS